MDERNREELCFWHRQNRQNRHPLRLEGVGSVSCRFDVWEVSGGQARRELRELEKCRCCWFPRWRYPDVAAQLDRDRPTQLSLPRARVTFERCVDGFSCGRTKTRWGSSTRPGGPMIVFVLMPRDYRLTSCRRSGEAPAPLARTARPQAEEPEALFDAVIFGHPEAGRRTSSRLLGLIVASASRASSSPWSLFNSCPFRDGGLGFRDATSTGSVRYHCLGWHGRRSPT